MFAGAVLASRRRAWATKAFTHRAGAEIELDPERLEDAAPDLVAERVVAEEPEAAGTAAGRDPRRHVADEAARRLGGERRQVGQARGLEFGAAGLGARQAAQAVER